MTAARGDLAIRHASTSERVTIYRGVAEHRCHCSKLSMVCVSARSAIIGKVGRQHLDGAVCTHQDPESRAY